LEVRFLHADIIRQRCDASNPAVAEATRWMFREKKLPDDWVLFDTKSMLGGALAGQKKFQEAEPLLVEGYSGMKEREAKIPPAAKTRLSEAIRRLIDLYTAWEKPEEVAKWQAKLEDRKREN
jgi:hypothetical protein